MKHVKALLLPFCDSSYDLQVAQIQIHELEEYLAGMGIGCEVRQPILDYAQAAEVADTVQPYAYDFPILFPVTWSEPRLAVTAARPFFGGPMVVWCRGWFRYAGERIEMSSTPAASALRGCLQEMGIPCEFFTDLPQSGEAVERLKAFAVAAKTIRRLRRAKLGFFGMNFNGITAADMDLSLLRRKFGAEVYTFDVSDLLAKMDSFSKDSDAYLAMQKRVDQKIQGTMGSYRDRIIRMCLSLEDYVQTYDLQVLDLRCHTELSQTYGLTACLPLSVLGDSVVCSCEADLPVAFTQLILSELAGQMSTYVDLRSYSDTHIEVGACGFAPACMTGGCADTGLSREPSHGYLTNVNPFDKGKVTLARLLKFPEGKLKLHVARGESCGMESNLREMGCACYPMGNIRLEKPVAQFLEYVGANHYALVYQNLEKALHYLCKYCNIELIHT